MKRKFKTMMVNNSTNINNISNHFSLHILKNTKNTITYVNGNPGIDRTFRKYSCFRFWFMVLDATHNNISVISWRSVLLMEETRVPEENHRPVTSNYIY